MKLVEKHEVISAQSQAAREVQLLIDTTDMESSEDRKRTKNYCDWVSKKTQIVRDEKSFDYNADIYKKVKRGTVIWIEFGFNIGDEFGGKHPAIVLRKTGSSVFVIPLSSKEPTQVKPHHVKIEKVYGFKNITRWANVLRLINVSLQRVDTTASIGNVKGADLDRINDAIKKTHVF